RPSCRARIPGRFSSVGCASRSGSGQGDGSSRSRCTLRYGEKIADSPASSGAPAMSSPTQAFEAADAAELRCERADEALLREADARLRTDIRLLGRILGDTVRDQEGDDV